MKKLDVIFNKFRKNSYRKISYSQCCEDLIIEYICNIIDMNNLTYVDIGAHHPVQLSNTYLFYKKGCSGVCIEPDPTLYSELKNKRRRDLCLNVGVGIGHDCKADYYIMTSKTLNTFSKETAERYSSYGKQQIEGIIQIPLISINKIVEQNFHPHPNLISLDVEGWELQILKTFDFKRFRPEIFCIETLTYAEDKSEKKLKDIINFMELNEYFVYADTFINSIFVEKNAWANRRQ
jgi:FkbM family methyltransferase